MRTALPDLPTFTRVNKLFKILLRIGPKHRSASPQDVIAIGITADPGSKPEEQMYVLVPLGKPPTCGDKTRHGFLDLMKHQGLATNVPISSVFPLLPPSEELTAKLAFSRELLDMGYTTLAFNTPVRPTEALQLLSELCPDSCSGSLYTLLSEDAGVEPSWALVLSALEEHNSCHKLPVLRAFRQRLAGTVDRVKARLAVRRYLSRKEEK
jgi:hypothetical protein